MVHKEDAALKAQGRALRRAGAVVAARSAATASRVLGRGGGTAMPGLVALRIDPDIVSELVDQLIDGSIVVTGTNGKTTTSRMLGKVLTDCGLLPLRNDAGSNLVRGLASSLVARANVMGMIARSRYRVGLFEVDEAALAQALPNLNPRALLLLNLFRDQLDRYGEVATVARIWQNAIAAHSPGTTIVANADDPLVADVAQSETRSTLFFGIQGAERELESAEHAGDVKSCPRCGGPIIYARNFLGHLGHYECPRCGFSRPQPEVWAEDVRLRGVDGSDFRLRTPSATVMVSLPLPGMYNVYNALGAAAAAVTLGIDAARISSSLSSVTAAFGRMERIIAQDRTIFVALAKNPAGLNEVLRTLAASGDAVHLMIMLNDNIADGRDVSWIWDADVEILQNRVASVVFGGVRAEDMALRFKYAGILGSEARPSWEICHDTATGLDRALRNTPPGGRIFLVPTYTALLDLYGVLTRRGFTQPFWVQ